MLGIGKDVPAASYVAASVIAAGIGSYCTAEVLSLWSDEERQLGTCCSGGSAWKREWECNIATAHHARGERRVVRRRRRRV